MTLILLDQLFVIICSGLRRLTRPRLIYSTSKSSPGNLSLLGDQGAVVQISATLLKRGKKLPLAYLTF